jgi:hypothetical protein
MLMDLIELEHKIIMKNGQKYELTKLEKPHDLTEQNDGIITTMTHKLEGFEEVLNLVTEETEGGGCFYWAYKAGNTGLYVNLMDEYIQQQVNEILFEMLEDEGWK